VTRDDVRKLILKALYGDSLLSEQLVLKGGNALALAYRVGGRTSLDLDFSIEGDFDDLPEVSVRMERALTEAFSAAGIRLFDFQFESRPKGPVSDWWGGYSAEFKLIPESRARELGQSVDEMRRQALTIDPGSQRRTYTVEISKHEFCGDKRLQRIDDFGVSVYTPLLLAAEKLRALLQQHPDYRQIDLRTKRSRARDLYDIWVISDHFSIRLEMNLATVRSVFEAKRVDLRLLAKLSDLRALHMASWSDVELAVSGPLESFDFYFEFVASAARSLHSKWVENSP
jgi:hypothetical protein